jgi:putative nucleotidyltransferase with HDIG domain
MTDPSAAAPPVPASAPPAMPSQGRLAAVIPRRPRVSTPLGILIALSFAAVVAPAITMDRWLGVTVEAGKPAPITVRVPLFGGADLGSDLETGDLRGGGIVVARGELVSGSDADNVRRLQATQPAAGSTLVAYLAILFALAAIYSHHLLRSTRGRLLRVQLINLGVLAAVAIGVKIVLMTTTVSVLVVPVALASLVPTLVLDRTVGLATGVLAALVMTLVVPFDLGVATILLAQASVAGLIVPDRTRRPAFAALIGGAVAAVSAGLTYGIYQYLATGHAPWSELSTPLASPWVAAVGGGVLAAVLAIAAVPLYQILVGEITQSTLVRLEDLSHPLLRQIATKSPGTWQHSLAMANMAELAANAIGANGRLVRVGAYFHDLGKSLQPKYFIENLEPGEQSPHERLAPEVSCDAIFAHVTEGITLAQRNKLPARIIDFMHMHHGNGVLEYFWGRCQEQGNPNRRTIEDFRYPGVPPHSRETAILAICDAVEAAARTLKRADDHSIGNLVQRIVYGKLHLGQLDDSGLSMGDLRRINDSLRETIKHAHHGRIEYPWQKAEAAQQTPVGTTLETTTQRLMTEPRLDSLDAPRPMWRSATSAPPPMSSSSADLAIATTGVVTPPQDDTVSLKAPSSQPPAQRTSAPSALPVPALPPEATLASQPPARRTMTPSDAAMAIAPTHPPVEGLDAPNPPLGHFIGAPPSTPPSGVPKSIATPSTVMAAVVASPVVGIAPTTIPGVTTDRLVTPAPPPTPGDHTRDQSTPYDRVDVGHESPFDGTEASDEVIAARPPPPPAHADDTGTGTRRPKRVRKPALIVDDPRPPSAPLPAKVEDATTEPRVPVFRSSSQALPLPAPPPSDPEIALPAPASSSTKPGSRAKRSTPWAQGLADRVDAALDDDIAQFGPIDTPVHAPTPAELASLSGNPEHTRQTPFHEIEALVRETAAGDDTMDDLPLFDERGGTRPPPPPGSARRTGSNHDAAAAAARSASPNAIGREATGGTRKPRATEEVEPEAIEATIDEVPRVKARPGEPIVGPPPATRPPPARPGK